MVSLKDIAAACGVSVATVSKAMNGAKDISAETAARIRKTAASMGYLTNAAARALKTNRTKNIGVLFADQGGRGLTHEFFAAVLDSFIVEAERHGYDITFINRNIVGRTTSYLQHCLYRGFDGVAIICVDFFDPEVQELVNSELPVVTVDHVFNNRISVNSDNITGLTDLVRYAYNKGHRRLAYIHGELTSVTQNRIVGFYRGCEELGLSPEDVIPGRYYDADCSYEITKQLLERDERPTCILFPDDFSLIGGIRAIQESGLRCPADISVLGYDGIVVSQVMSPRITTYKQNTTELGKVAAQKLVELIDHPRTTLPDRISVQGSILEGDSVADINPAP